ncbi:MAG: adenylate/guanylate cyclase domain-containing protein [Desulfobacterales bacterium]|jgi:adenylate cyclase
MTEEGFKRKLAAILSADVEGYSRLMGDDEEATVRTLKSYREVLSTLIQQQNGKVLDSPGDNLMAEFVSVVDAVQCAVAVQKEIYARNEELPENRRMQFRIGINLGDVIQEEGRIYGDGVNIAARLEGLAEPGGICISKTAFDHIESKLPYGYDFIGDQTVKNIAKPIGAYRVLLDPRVTVSGKPVDEKPAFIRRTPILVAAAAVIVVAIAVGVWQFYTRRPPIEPASADKMAFPLPDKPSIAVLPFTNISDDPDHEYFSDGITEEIITALSKIPKLFVIARNSTFTYKGKSIKIQQVSEELGVQYVVEGSVRKANDRVRITAQLIDALTGHHMWAEKYDRHVEDIFAVQDEITKKIITALQIELTEGEQANVYSSGSDNLEAYLKAMEANWLNSQSSKEGILKARKLAEEAIALDPEYAFAYRVLGSNHGMSLAIGMSKNPRESLKHALELFRKAIELDDLLATAHSSLGIYSMYARQYDTALAEGKRAIELQPNLPDVVICYATILSWLGKPEEAIPFFKEGLRLTPKPPTAYLRLFAGALRDSGQYEAAIAQAQKATEQEPNDLISWVTLVSSLSLEGREEEARTAAKEILRIRPNFSVASYEKRAPQKDRATVKRFGDALRAAGLPE